jgi:hypothetical protein
MVVTSIALLTFPMTEVPTLPFVPALLFVPVLTSPVLFVSMPVI